MKVSDLYLRDFTKDFNMVLIFLRGFKRFCKVSENKNGIRWNCIRRRQGCRSFLVTDHKVEEILAQGYLKHTCRKTKKEKQKSKESKQRIKDLFRKHGYSPLGNSRNVRQVKDFGNLSYVCQILNRDQEKKVSFIEPPLQKAPEDPKEYITQYFKRDIEKQETLNTCSTPLQPQDQVGQKMRSVLTIPKLGQTGATFITDYFKEMDMKEQRAAGTQTESVIHQLSQSTLVNLRNLMNEKNNQ